MRVPQVLWLVPLAIIIGFGGVIGYFAGEEIRNSKFQSDYLSRIANEITFERRDGPSDSFRVPSDGPYNLRLGYSHIPSFVKALEAEDYEVASQARASPRYVQLVNEGLYPVYRPKTVAGLLVKDRDSRVLYHAAFPSHVFSDFESIPPLLVDTLLFIENRELFKESAPTRNPVVEWDRFAYAALGQALRVFVPAINLGGGSTLATQIEKFRFSPGGQTTGPVEKLRQMVSGSLRVYLDGPDTRAARKQIVLDYLNSTPLAARAGFGEINSIGDGMWAWFGRDLDEVRKALALPEDDPVHLARKAGIYREILGLILAQRRPTHYLVKNREALGALTDKMLEALLMKGVVSPALFKAARLASFRFLPVAPPPPAMAFLDNKATNALRARLRAMLGLKNLYELDRLDLLATGTLDAHAQDKVTEFLKNMGDPAFLEKNGLYGFRLLSPENDPSAITWSVLLYEKTALGNVLRVQADTIDAPLDMNEGAKLDLGSTAKLRTLVTYLEIVSELYRRYAGLTSAELRDLADEAPDVLTSWAIVWLSDNPQASLDETLFAAMARTYSASPNETFFTGGGVHVFSNFERSDDSKKIDVRTALRDSVNLVFVRLMRDIVNYTIAQGQQTKQELLSDPDHPARKAYLERFAEKEGAVFLNRFIKDYESLDADEITRRIAARARHGAAARTILFRSLYPAGKFSDYVAFMREHAMLVIAPSRLEELFAQYPPERHSLADRGYIAGVNPLELWLAAHRIAHPKDSRKKILEHSRQVRIECYAWLIHSNKKAAQDSRIRILLEQDAFARIQRRWERLGYPFERLVPSLATAIGTSADRPAALAELVGILLNDGVRRPMRRFETLHFAKGTPFETVLTPGASRAARVLDPAIARTARAAMMEVVENGTARRLRGAYVDERGRALVVGAKTGTGDHRYDEYGAGRKLISSRVVNRTGTIVFYIGDRFFGTVTAHVAGERAGAYRFTSALSAQMLKALASALQPLITPDGIVQPLGEEIGLAQETVSPSPAPDKAGKDEPKPAKKAKKKTPAVLSRELLMDILH